MNISPSFTVYSSQYKNGDEVKDALEQYDSYLQKSTLSLMSSGRKKLFKCTDPVCPFTLIFLRKRASKSNRNSAAKSIPDQYWYVSKFDFHSNSCCSIPKISAKQLAKLPAFKSAVLGSKDKVASESMLKNVVLETYNHGQLSHTIIQRARDVVRNTSDHEHLSSYAQIPGLCSEITKDNPGSRICFQLDQDKRFYRLFILLHSSLIALDGCLPVLEIDGTFMKHPSYNGVCVVIISKTGDKKNVPIALSFVPCESTDHFIWIFLNLKAAGIPFDNLAVFSDRGKQMNAHRRLVHFGCTWLHLKSCTYHIMKNVCAIFSPNDHFLSDYIFKLQGSDSINFYVKTFIEISSKYGVLNENHEHHFKGLIGGTIMEY
jgi:MULE transposase domain